MELFFGKEATPLNYYFISFYLFNLLHNSDSFKNIARKGKQMSSPYFSSESFPLHSMIIGNDIIFYTSAGGHNEFWIY